MNNKTIVFKINGEKILLDKTSNRDLLNSIRLNKQVYNFASAERKGDYSYTVRIPINDYVNRIFKFKNDLKTINKFNELQFDNCEIIVAGTSVINGTFILNRITNLHYEGNIIGKNIDFALLLEKKTLNDLSFPLFPFNGLHRDRKVNSDYIIDHYNYDTPRFDLDSIKDLPNSYTWDEMNQLTDLPGYFTMISYGNFPYSKSDDVSTEDIDETEGDDRISKLQQLSLKDLTLSIRYIEVLKQMFKDIGYSLKGEVIEDNYFKYLSFNSNKSIQYNYNHLAQISTKGSNTLNNAETKHILDDYFVLNANNDKFFRPIPTDDTVSTYRDAKVKYYALFNDTIVRDYYSAGFRQLNNEYPDLQSAVVPDALSYLVPKSGRYKFKLRLQLSAVAYTVLDEDTSVATNQTYYTNVDLGSFMIGYVRDRSGNLDENGSTTDSIITQCNLTNQSLTGDVTRPYKQLYDEDIIGVFRPLSDVPTTVSEFLTFSSDSYKNQQYLGNEGFEHISLINNMPLIPTVNFQKTIAEYLKRGVIPITVTNEVRATDSWGIPAKADFYNTLNTELYNVTFEFYNNALSEGDIIRLMAIIPEPSLKINGVDFKYKLLESTIEYADTDSSTLFDYNLNMPDNINQLAFFKDFLNTYNLNYDIINNDSNNSKEIFLFKQKDYFLDEENDKTILDDLSKKAIRESIQIEPLTTYNQLKIGYNFNDTDDYKDNIVRNGNAATLFTVNNNIYSEKLLDKTSTIFFAAYDKQYFITDSVGENTFINLVTISENESNLLLRNESTINHNTNGLRIYFLGKYDSELDTLTSLTTDLFIEDIQDNNSFLPKIQIGQWATTRHIIESVYNRKYFKFNDIRNRNNIINKFFINKFYDLSHGHLIRFNAAITETEFAKIDLRKKIQFNGEMMYINKIDGFDPITNVNTVIELIKI